MDKPNWSELLENATREPGTLSVAYRAFHNYSLGNQMLASVQCASREIPTGPIATYKTWASKGRQVRKGEKALTLWMPIIGKRENAEGEVSTFARFTFASKWFAIAQTDGEDVEIPEVPLWSREKALAALNIHMATFTKVDGNTQGYAYPSEREIAINPIADHPLNTLFHEFAHVLLHSDKIVDGETLGRSLIEVEAEATAMLVMASLGHDVAESRGYIQNWYNGDTIPAVNAGRIIQAADKILKAGA